MEHMSAPSAVRISKKDWIPGRFHRRSRVTGWAPKVRKTDTLEDGRSILRRHRKALAGVGWDPGNRRCVSGTQVGGLPGQL